ncbi:MAG TPA: shikimate kinase [Geobacteraceae bacterium]|nr:shikimate kinase [Geobacteraceae bacterium]
MNIVLIGYRGTGKSHVGRLLAERLGLSYVGMDAAIVASAGMPIPEIVAREGWPGFRDRESAEVVKVAGRDGLVIDTGGGVIERPENVDVLRRSGCIVWLKASVPTIVARIQGDTERPSLTGAKSFTEEVAEVLERRTPAYAAAAQVAIDTDELTPEEIATRIATVFQEGCRS